jgi:hypothetical protein
MPRTIRRTLVDNTPRWLRPRLSRDQVLDLKLLHIAILDDIHAGRATIHTLWELAAMAFTWSRVAELLGLGVEQIAPQLHLATRLIERFGTTGQVRFEGAEYDAARIGTIVMDLLAEQTDAATARAASVWSEACMASLRAAHEGRAA